MASSQMKGSLENQTDAPRKDAKNHTVVIQSLELGERSRSGVFAQDMYDV